MVLLGVILLILGLVLAVPLLFWIGVIVAIVGAVLLFAAYSGHGRYLY